MENVNRLRYVLLLLCLAVALGVLNALIKGALVSLLNEFSLDFLGGAVFVGGFLGVMFGINRLIKNGRCQWLLKTKD